MTATTTPSRRRARTILANRRPELLNALLVVVYLVVYTVALSAIALGPTIITFLWSPARFDGPPDRALAAAAELALFEERVWPLALGLILIFGLHSIHMSMRVFGPIARMQAESAQVAAGDLRRRMRLRKNDNLAGLCTTWNSLVAALDERVGRAQSAVRECRERLDDLQRAQFRGPADRHAAVTALSACIARLQTELSVFETSSPSLEEIHGEERHATTAGSRTAPGAPAAAPGGGSPSRFVISEASSCESQNRNPNESPSESSNQSPKDRAAQA